MCLIKCEHLQSLSICLSEMEISKETFYSIPSKKDLKFLLFKCDWLSNILPRDVAQLLNHSNLKYLTSLNLSSKNIRIFENDVLIAIASSHQHLTYLRLTQIENYQESYQGLHQVLNKCKKLETLILDVWIIFNFEEFKRIFSTNLPPCLKYMKMECWESIKSNEIRKLVISSEHIEALNLGNKLFFSTKRSNMLHRIFRLLPKVFHSKEYKDKITELSKVEGFLTGQPKFRATPFTQTLLFSVTP